MKFSLLSREQELKKTFLQLGNKFGLPKDLIILIYTFLALDKKKEEDLYRYFYSNYISFNIYEPISSFGVEGMIFSQKDIFSPKNPYSYRIPINRNIEWIIKSEKDHSVYLLDSDMIGYLNPRDILLNQIEMIGDTNFIHKDELIPVEEINSDIEWIDIYDNAYRRGGPASLRDRINFMNNESFDTIINHYDSYLQSNDLGAHSFTIIIYNDGEFYTQYIPLQLIQ